MTISQRIDQRQQQSLVMTQQLQQSIKLLQLSSLDLQDFIATEIEKNPLLSEGEVSADSSQTDSDQHSSTEDEQRGLREEIVDAQFSDRQEREVSDHHYSSSAGSFSGYTGDGNLLEKTVSEKVSLRDHLTEHLLCSTEDISQRIIGMHLIDMVNASGYLADNYAELTDVLQCSSEELEAVVYLLQKVEPAGLCARNVAESMAIQLEEKGELTELMQGLLDHLDLLSRSDYVGLRKALGISREELIEMVEELRLLNPKPGLAFDYEEVQAIQPDIFVRARGRDWEIELNPLSLPKVLVNNDYYAEVTEKTRDKEEKSYLGEQLSHANWLVKSLDQRAQTILKTTKEIVKRQANFFRHGVRYLKPLTLKEVADAIEMHESTISRVTSNKYLACNGATYELKFFFTSSVQSSFGGDDISSKAVQHLIQSLVEAETDAKSVLSDEAIATKLQDQGVDVARRTVAKYRDILNIPSSAQRKRQFKAKL